MSLLLWAFALQLVTLGETISPIKAAKFQPIPYFPPPNKRREDHTAAAGEKKAEKKKAMASRKHSSLACIKFWLVVGSTMLLIIWVCIMQMASLDGAEELGRGGRPGAPLQLPRENVDG
ncbi:hypothetical protein CCACVL1_06427 [Corchorus capsularis]|uniref:Transmembrane protein n=1 Tax=Corchorus capsularis TaxID=210143 RepID=A0A1R3JFM9_COCAP|nr:hypothetical protein CCACVL1_06427 [Corchorus capsularis]